MGEIEIWKDVVGYEGLYQVSDLGRVKSFHGKGRILKHGADKHGYVRVTLNKCGVGATKKIHQLVAIEFLGHTPNGVTLIVHHKDNNKLNNKLSNLEIVSQRENLFTHHKGGSIYKGVYLEKSSKKWRARVDIGNKKRVSLGCYNCEHEAGAAYQKALVKFNLI